MVSLVKKKGGGIKWPIHFKWHTSIITDIILGALKYCMDNLFFKSKTKNSIYNGQENQYGKWTFSVKQTVYEILFLS